jgi:hypothetical protein
MALDHATTFPVQLGKVLVISDSIRKFWEYCILASNANHYARLLSAANAFGQSDTEQKTVYTHLSGSLEGGIANDIAAKWIAWKQAIYDTSKGLFYLMLTDLPASDEKNAGGGIVYEYDDEDGQITIIAWRGLWGALRKDMLLNSYKVVANVIGFGSFTADSPNRGILAVTSMTGLSHTLRGKSAGTLIFTVESEDTSHPKLKVQLELAIPLPDGRKLIDADRLLECEKTWEDGQTGITCVLTRSGLASPTESGDGGNMFSSTSFSTPKEADMNGGVVQIRVVRISGDYDFLIEWYANSDRTNRVGSLKIAGTTGTVAIDKTLRNGTRFQSTFSKVNAAAALPSVDNEDNDISFDIETPRIGDRWTRPVTNDQAGKIATKLAELDPVSLPTTGSNLYTDANADAITV